MENNPPSREDEPTLNPSGPELESATPTVQVTQSPLQPEQQIIQPVGDSTSPPHAHGVFKRPSLFQYNKGAFIITLIAAAVITIGGLVALGLLLSKKDEQATSPQSNSKTSDNYSVGDLKVEQLPGGTSVQLQKAEYLLINGQLQVGNTLVLYPSAQPDNPVTGQFFFDKTTSVPYYYNGSQFISLGPTALPPFVATIGGASGNVALGPSLQLVNGQLDVSASYLQQVITSQFASFSASNPQTQPTESANLTCPAGSGNLTGGGNTLQLNTGGTCNGITITDSPTFSGTLAVTGDLQVGGTASVGTLGSGGTQLVCTNGSSQLSVCDGITGVNFILNTTSTQSANINVQSANGADVAAVIRGNASQSADIFQVKDGSTSANNLFSIGNNGAVVFRPVEDSSSTFQIRNTDNASLFNISTLGSNNLILNPSFEQSTGNWNNMLTGGNISRTTAQHQFGAAAAQIGTSLSGQGIRQNRTLASSTAYSMSFYVRTDDPGITISYGWYRASATDLHNCASGVAINSSWQRVTCTFTSFATMTASTGVYIVINQSSAHTFYVDGVQLELGSNVTNYAAGEISFGAPIVSATTFQNTTNSSTAFVVQNAAGSNALRISTDNVVSDFNSAAATLYVGRDSVTSRSINAAGSINASGADYAEWIPWSSPKPATGSIVTYNGSNYVVSSKDTAAFVGNDVFNETEALLVTFAGQVPVRVTGPVAVGDILISNGDGTARAVNASNATIGNILAKVAIAQEASSDPGVKLVKASVGTSSATVGDALQQAANFNSIVISGDVAVSGTLQAATIKTTQLEVAGHIITSGNLPVVQALVAAGAGATASVNGNDVAGTITLVTGSTPSTGDLLVLNFNQAYGAAPRVSITPANDAAAQMRVSRGATSNAGVTFRTVDAPQASTTYVYDYFIVQ